MLKLQQDGRARQEVPERADDRAREGHRGSGPGRARGRRRPAETFGLRELRNLSIFGVVWGAYLWGHVAGAIELFGRP